jgi:hypothetical protein
MFKSKNAVIGLAAVVVASVLLVAGLGVTATTGAATDFTPPEYPLEVPPAAPVEPPAANPIDTGNPAGDADPTGDQDGAGAAPAGTLPNAGYGTDVEGVNPLALALAAAGLAFVGAGATVVASRRS